MNFKKFNRDPVKKKRQSLPLEAVKSMSSAINDRLLSVILKKKIRHCAVFYPIQNEPDLLYTYSTLSVSGVSLYLPKPNDRPTEPYQLAPWEIKDPLKQDRFCVPSPLTDSIPVQVSDRLIDCWLIPGLAFSFSGARIGFGGGYYDRLLATADGVKIGIAYDFQLYESLPTQTHDIRMEMVVSPTQTIYCNLHS